MFLSEKKKKKKPGLRKAKKDAVSVSPLLNARELGMYWLWLASPF